VSPPDRGARPGAVHVTKARKLAPSVKAVQHRRAGTGGDMKRAMMKRSLHEGGAVLRRGRLIRVKKFVERE